MTCNSEYCSCKKEKCKSQGPTGPRGPCGPRGKQGCAGPQGPQGPQGCCGPCGPCGPCGKCGPTGPQGSKGPRGCRGERGCEGPQGNAGPQGVMGEKGDQGIQGLPGPAGQQGEQGMPGVTGPIGPTGPQGNPGATGIQGQTGSQGIDGPTGPDGCTGCDGPTGTVGPTGPRGDACQTVIVNFNSLCDKPYSESSTDIGKCKVLAVICLPQSCLKTLCIVASWESCDCDDTCGTITFLLKHIDETGQRIVAYQKQFNIDCQIRPYDLCLPTEVCLVPGAYELEVVKDTGDSESLARMYSVTIKYQETLVF